MRWIAGAFVVLALALAGCQVEETSTQAEENGDPRQAKEGEKESQEPEGSGPFAEARIRGRCPSFLTVGIPTEITARITNTGSQDWPVTFLSVFDGLENFIVISAQVGTLVGRKAYTPGIETYGFGAGAGIKAGETETAVFALTPKEAGSIELSFGAWGGEEGEESVPSDLRLVACEDLAINP